MDVGFGVRMLLQDVVCPGLKDIIVKKRNNTRAEAHVHFSLRGEHVRPLPDELDRDMLKIS